MRNEHRKTHEHEGGVQVLDVSLHVFSARHVGFLAIYGEKPARELFVSNGLKESLRTEWRVVRDDRGKELLHLLRFLPNLSRPRVGALEGEEECPVPVL